MSDSRADIQSQGGQGEGEVTDAGWWSRFGSWAVLAFALVAMLPTAGDFGLTWDEPAYRYSQVISFEWWRQWLIVRSAADVQAQVDPDALLYYWPYGRFGINFHPPLAGQLSLAGSAATGRWMKDIPSRRVASIVEFAITIAILHRFLSRRYGPAVGLIAAGSLLFMPRLYGQAHLLDTDIPGLLLWASTALAFWKGLHEPDARRWRVLVGVLMGLAFVEKMAAVGVLLPILIWLTIAWLPSAFSRKTGRAAWIDAAATLGLMIIPLGVGFVEIQLLQRKLPPPAQADLFFLTNPRPQTWVPGGILALPLCVWWLRRLAARWRPASPIWGAERPALETLASILAFAPVVGWLGNPAWWRDTIVRLTHYYTLSNDRQGALPDILILYFGQIYKYSLPWHNGWVLTAITVPPTILLAGLIGIVWGLRRTRQDRIPVYFLLHMATLPCLRMLHTPAHDGVRLMLPTFFFLSAFAGMGAVWIGSALSSRVRWGTVLAGALVLLPPVRVRWGGVLVGALVLLPPVVALVRIHPYELSYYNMLIGGPAGAWRRGFEMTYWYDAITPSVVRDLNEKLPTGAELDHLNKKTETSMQVFQELQDLGHLRPDVRLFRRSGDRFPFVILLSQDSKATAFTRLLFAMKPWYASEPPQLSGLRIATVADPLAVSRAWALSLLVDAPAEVRPPRAVAPAWVHAYAPFLKRFWGEGLQPDDPLGVNLAVLRWAQADPAGLKAAARWLSEGGAIADHPAAARLHGYLVPEVDGVPQAVRQELLSQVLRARPEALGEAVDILVDRPEAVVDVITRYGYTDPAMVGGFLDRGLNP